MAQSSAAGSFFNAYVDGENVVLLARDGDRIKVTRSRAEYVTYVRAKDVTEGIERQFRNSSALRSQTREGEWIRLGWKSDEDRIAMCRGLKQRSLRTREVETIPSPFMVAGIDLFEGDVDPIRRFMVDSGSTVQAPRRCYLDFEADSRVPFATKEDARILSWSLWDDTGEIASALLEDDSNAAECEILGQLWRVLEGYDQVLAWNGDNYDFPLLGARTDLVRLRVDPRRWLWLDQLSLFRNMNKNASESGDEKQSLALNAVAMTLLGVGKDDFNSAQTWQAWHAGGESRAKLFAYNKKDVELQKRIEAKTGYASLYAVLADVVRVFPDSEGLNPTHQVDAFLLRLGLEQGHHFATKRFYDDVEKFKGAYVMDPKCRGVMRDVHVCDFASLYPSVILTWNMSPETKVGAPINGPIPPNTCRSPLTGISFRTDVPGILPTALKTMINLRKFWNDKKAALPPGTTEWKDADRRSVAYKVAGLIFFGVIGSPFSRYFDREVAESITQNGVWLIKETNAAAEARGMEVLYSDTDSAFVAGVSRTEFESFVGWCNEDLYPKLLADKGCVENHVKLAYEKQFERLVVTGAKRYAGNYVHFKGTAGKPIQKPGEGFDKDVHSKPEIKGLEYKRGDALQLTRRLQEQIVLRVLSGDESHASYEVALDDAMQHILQGELPIEEVQLTKSLTKSLKEYVTRVKKDGSPGAELAHVQVAKILKDRGIEVTRGTRINYVIADGASAPNKVLPAADYDGTNADRFYLWEDQVWPATQRFLEAAFPDWEWERWDKIRPPKPRVPKKGKPVAKEQHPFKFVVDAPFVITITEPDAPYLGDLVAVLKRHPGMRPLQVRVRLDSGAIAGLSSSLYVSGSKEMIDALQAVWSLAMAAYREWATLLTG